MIPFRTGSQLLNICAGDSVSTYWCFIAVFNFAFQCSSWYVLWVLMHLITGLERLRIKQFILRTNSIMLLSKPILCVYWFCMGFSRLGRKGSVLISQGAFRPKGQNAKKIKQHWVLPKRQTTKAWCKPKSLLGILEWFGKAAKRQTLESR